MVILKCNLIGLSFYFNERDKCLTQINQLIKDLKSIETIIDDDLLAFIYITKTYLHTWLE